MGIGDVDDQRGVGHVTIWNAHDGLLEWSEQDMQAAENNFGAMSGNHIMWLDFDAALLDVQVANASHIVVHNAFGNAEKVDLTLIY
jgi:hypothetical protein